MLAPKSLVATTLALASGVLSASSPCPFNYPATLNNTESSSGLVFTVISNNATINNRAVQLRPNPFLEGGFFGGIDASSPVLLSNFREGGFYSQARDEFNRLYDLGPTGYLNQRDVTDGTTRYSFAFANATQWPGEVEKEWYLSGGSSTGSYYLYHNEPLDIVHGFLLCDSEIDLDHGPWSQLFYQTYSQIPHEFPNCESVGVRTTVAATIYNGACDIGGWVAE
ncbi:hypothetical protein F4779DRAFT_591483 [Xylariaceae sp. FL0662B]|nr:hypothetical protein F4779DRAFT_591483 [Xylariaceae sp. FL0662B]